MTRPRLLILDEPSIGLAPRVVAEIFEVLGSLTRAGLSLLLVEQNVQLSLRSVDYAYVLKQGRIVLEGTPADLSGNSSEARISVGDFHYGCRSLICRSPDGSAASDSFPAQHELRRAPWPVVGRAHLLLPQSFDTEVHPSLLPSGQDG